MTAIKVEIDDTALDEAAQKRIKELQAKIKKLEGEVGKLNQQKLALEAKIKTSEWDRSSYDSLRLSVLELVCDHAYSEARDRFDYNN